MAKNRDRKLYVVDYLITPDERIDKGAVLCEGDRILAVGGLSGFSIEDELQVERFENAYMTPGFIDTHIHGAGGFDSSRCLSSPHKLADMSRVLGERGVTGFFPTVVADRPEVMLKNLQDLSDAMRQEMPGAEALAIHVEGPFLNPAKCGAQLKECLQPIDINFAAELIAAGNGMVKSMTPVEGWNRVAIDGIYDVIPALEEILQDPIHHTFIEMTALGYFSRMMEITFRKLPKSRD